MKIRFANILDMGKRKKGIIAVATVFCVIIISSIIVTYRLPSPVNASPTDIVTRHLTAEKNNDFKLWISTLTANHQFSQNVLGVISLDIIEVKNELNSQYMDYALKSSEAIQNGWTKDNFAFVWATYDILHDNTLVPDDNGRMEIVYELFRTDENSPWLIKDWGVARY